jgi:hypothetical protein
MIFGLLGEEHHLDAEGRACYRNFDKSFRSITVEEHNLRSHMNRVSEAIREIRVLSGVDGINLELIEMEKVLQQSILRLEENVGLYGKERLIVHSDPNFAHVRCWAHPVVLKISLERMFRAVLSSTQDNVYVNVQTYTDENRHVLVEFLFKADNQKAGALFTPQILELLEDLAYTLKPYSTILLANTDRQSVQIILKEDLKAEKLLSVA